MNFTFSDDLKKARNIVNRTGYGISVKKIDISLWVHILASPYTSFSHMVLGKLFKLSVPQCPHP